MIIPDVNLLLYATFNGYPLHEQAMQWLNESMSGTEEFGLTAPAVFGFVRLGTSARVHERPLSVTAAAGYVNEWLERPHSRFLAPGPGHVRLALSLLEVLGTGGNLTTDAQLAAYSLEFGGTIHSNDTDFGKFSGLRWTNPLV